MESARCVLLGFWGKGIEHRYGRKNYLINGSSVTIPSLLVEYFVHLPVFCRAATGADPAGVIGCRHFGARGSSPILHSFTSIWQQARLGAKLGNLLALISNLANNILGKNDQILKG